MANSVEEGSVVVSNEEPGGIAEILRQWRFDRCWPQASNGKVRRLIVAVVTHDVSIGRDYFIEHNQLTPMLSTGNSRQVEMAKVLLLYNAPVLPEGHPDVESERDLLHTVDAVDEALRQHQHGVYKLGLTNSPSVLLEEVKRVRPDVIFNLFEGFGDRPASEYHIAGLIEWLGIPYTGCPLEAMVVGRDKVRTKYLLQGAKLPTADFYIVRQLDELPEPSSWPVMVKPASTDASIGIYQESVVSDQPGLRRQVELLLKRFAPPVLVETYLPGTEYNVGVIECPSKQALPVAELVYSPQPGVAWPIVSYASKWEPGSAEDLAMQPRCPAILDQTMQQRLQQIALAAFDLIGCRDIARVDIRLDAQGDPRILEVNPNPDLGPSAGLARMVRTAGIDYAAFVHQLVQNHITQ